MKLLEKINRARASAQGMTPEQYRKYKSELAEIEFSEKLTFKKEQIVKKYADRRAGKKSSFDAGGILNSVTKMGDNVLKHTEEYQKAKKRYE